MHLLVLVGSLGSICTLNLKSLQLHPLQTADRTLYQEMSSVAESDTADGGRHRRRRRVDRHERRCRCRCSTSASKPLHNTRHRSHNSLVFGCMNVRSAAGKIDDIIAMKRDQSIDVLCLCETWHDEDSVSIRRLRAEGLQVLERARPRSVSELSTLSTNPGGVAIAGSRGLWLGMVELCAKNLQIMRNDFTDYARTFCQLCAPST